MNKQSAQGNYNKRHVIVSTSVAKIVYQIDADQNYWRVMFVKGSSSRFPVIQKSGFKIYISKNKSPPEQIVRTHGSKILNTTRHLAYKMKK